MRKIVREWIEQVLQNTVFEGTDPHHPMPIRAYAPIAAFGNRMLRVVYYDTGTEIRVITLFLIAEPRRGVECHEDDYG